jgi:hypothetical protein
MNSKWKVTDEDFKPIVILEKEFKTWSVESRTCDNCSSNTWDWYISEEDYEIMLGICFFTLG